MINSKDKKQSECSTKELAELLLSMDAGTIFNFTTAINDYEEDGTPIEAWPWYSAVIIRIFDVFSVYINRCSFQGGAAFTFDLPDYDESTYECLPQMIKGLSRFNEMFGERENLWYVDKRPDGFLKVEFTDEIICT